MYRPPGWEKLRVDAFVRVCAVLADKRKPEAVDLIEAGADAMLTALIAKGSRTHMFRTNSNPISISNPRKRGWYVFIEDVK